MDYFQTLETVQPENWVRAMIGRHDADKDGEVRRTYLNQAAHHAPLALVAPYLAPYDVSHASRLDSRAAQLDEAEFASAVEGLRRC